MFKIVRFPSKLKSFFNLLRNQFHFNHFEYFQTLVLLTAFCFERRNISRLCRQPWLLTAELQNEARCTVWDDLTDYLKEFSSGPGLSKSLSGS